MSGLLGCTVGIWHIAHIYQAYFPCKSKSCFREQFVQCSSPCCQAAGVTTRTSVPMGGPGLGMNRSASLLRIILAVAGGMAFATHCIRACVKKLARGTANLAGHNIAMLEEWSDLCGAYWPCQQISDVDSLYATYPISRDATLARIARGML